ncbi:MAG: efflux RND transporter permease subunit [Ectothiorhodospiraceae bacterium]|nr:efflux RND transporter permease subunit [Ectothiorhodospiraceae bacterium]
MRLPAICIERPVFATVLSLVLVLVGLVSFQRLTVREYPKVDPPVVTVTTNYKGASAEIIETQVTQVLEESLAGIEGIDYMTSISRSEQSQITLRFLLDREPDGAASDVRDRVSRVRGRLPDEIDEPIIQKVEADAQAVFYLSLLSDRHSQLEVSDLADRVLKEQLQTLPGVAEVRIFGERRYAMRLWLDPERLAAHGLTPQQVEDALRAQNVEVPAGRIESAQREFTVLSETDLRTPTEFEELILSDADGHLVRLRDVGVAALGARDERRVNRFNGQTSVTAGVVKQATANPLDVSNAIRSELPRILDTLPEGVSLQVAYDKSIFIAKSIENVYQTIVEAVALVVLIIFVFLRSWRAVLVPLVTIPVSLIGALGLVYAFGFSINTLTLLALVLAIGLVVDDAIVMLENIHRHVENGLTPMAAAHQGSREIAFAVLSMTLTLTAVYAPIAFVGGTTGRLFSEFALTLAGAVLISGFVALSLSPMMCSRLLREHERHGWLFRASERVLQGMVRGYGAVLRFALRGRYLVVLIGLGVGLSCIWLHGLLKSELAPFEDQGTVVVVGSGPEGATVDYMDGYARRVETILQGTPEIERSLMIIGFPTVNRVISFNRLEPWETRERRQQDVVAELLPKIASVPGLRAFPTNPPPLGQSVRSTPVELVLQTSQPYDALAEMVERFVERASRNQGLLNLDSDLKLTVPQLKVIIDRDKAADLGISVQQIGRTLETMLGGRQVTRFKRAGKQYDVIVQVAGIDRRNPDDLKRIHVRGASGEMIPLANLVRLEETTAPRELNHFNQRRSATITATLVPGYALGEALVFLEDVAREVLPGGTTLDYGGQSREFKTSSASLGLTFGLALAFIYLVLAAQFESFRDPFIIMLTVPLSIAGALGALYLTDNTLNIYSQVGLVTLIGLITKHGILIVDFANRLRAEGREVVDAVVQASALRLRPILMTTGAMVLGALPLALAVGAGAEGRRQIGVVIVGGLLVGTLFTLFVIPAAYTFLAARRAPVAVPGSAAAGLAGGVAD